MPRSYDSSGRRLSRWGPASSASTSTSSTTSVLSSATPTTDSTCDARARVGTYSSPVKTPAPALDKQASPSYASNNIKSLNLPSPRALWNALKLRK